MITNPGCGHPVDSGKYKCKNTKKIGKWKFLYFIISETFPSIPPNYNNNQNPDYSGRNQRKNVQCF